MPPSRTNQRTMRYSPKPRGEYKRTLQGVDYGPAASRLLEPNEVWNLAYLSFPYEKLTDHPDPMFTTHVRRSTQMRLNGTGLGMAEDPTTLVGSLLNLPAPRFLYLLERSPAFLTLPLFVTYGHDWLEAAHLRARFCEWGAHQEPEPTQDSILQANLATFQAMRRV